MVLGGGNDLGLWRQKAPGGVTPPPDGLLCTIDDMPICTIDGNRVCITKASPPAYTLTDGDDMGVPLALVVKLCLPGKVITSITPPVSNVLVGVNGSTVADRVITGEGTDCLCITYPTTFIGDTIQTDFNALVDGWAVTDSIVSAGVRP